MTRVNSRAAIAVCELSYYACSEEATHMSFVQVTYRQPTENN